MRLGKCLLAALLWISFAAIPAGLSSYAHLDIHDLHGRADTVVKGTVVDVSTSEDARHFYLVAEIEVEEYLKNPLESRVVFVQSSERKWIDGIAYETPGLVNFSSREKVIVYLERITPEFFTPVGARQGKFILIGSSYVNPDGEVIREPNPYSSWVAGFVVIGAFGIGIVYFREMRGWRKVLEGLRSS
jgi:hypothetical protein